jgi:anaerobic magnesium-protoporphyrin IX monomethyl ester cyclase
MERPPKQLNHVLCVYPYRRELNDVGFFPPMGLEFIAKVIQPYSQKIDIVDLRREPGRAKDFLRPDTDMVCFSVNWNRDREFLLNEIRSIPPGVFTVLGGRHATEDPQQWLVDCPNVTAVVRGDGEEAMEEICSGVPLEQITGLSFRSNGQIVHNPNRTPGPVRDVFPDRRLRRYTYDATIGGAGTGIKVDLIVSSRGCPFNCNFCSFSRNPWGTRRKWSARSPESVVAELEQIRAKLVGFTDDLFTYDMDRVERICDLILAKGIRKRYFVNARLEIAKRPDVMRKMEQAGYAMLMLGIESAQDRTLRSMQKGFDTAKIREYFKVLRESKMLLHGYFILGNIGESRREIEQILPFARELGLDTIALSRLRVSPYSGLDELVAATPGYHVAPGGKIYSDECSIDDLRLLRDQIHRGFYSPLQILRILHKCLRNRWTPFLLSLLPRVPMIVWQTAVHRLRVAKQHARRRGQAQASAVGPPLVAENKVTPFDLRVQKGRISESPSQGTATPRTRINA